MGRFIKFRITASNRSGLFLGLVLFFIVAIVVGLMIKPPPNADLPLAYIALTLLALVCLAFYCMDRWGKDRRQRLAPARVRVDRRQPGPYHRRPPGE